MNLVVEYKHAHAVELINNITNDFLPTYCIRHLSVVVSVVIFLCFGTLPGYFKALFTDRF